MITVKPSLRYRSPGSGLRSWLSLFLCLGIPVLVLVCVFLRTTVVGQSMVPTLNDGDRYLLLRTHRNPWIHVHAGDIVVADHDDGYIVKRVIAVPGDTLEIRSGTVYRNGSILPEPYINEPMDDQDLGPMTLGDDQYFLMGDNRNRSADSRIFGAFSYRSITGVLYPEAQPFLWTCYGLLLIFILAMAWRLAFSSEEDDIHAA